jgi:MFS family permease
MTPRGLRARLSPTRVTGGAVATPLLLLFGLNAMEQLDTSVFNILTPNIRDAFHLKNEGILAVIGIVAVVALGSQVLVGYYADRYSRVRIATIGALVWALFTILTGLAPGIVVLIVARSLSGVGRAVNDPTHNSLIVF